MQATYQTRISDYQEAVTGQSGDAALSAYAGLYGRVQRKLFSDMLRREDRQPL